MPLVVDLTDEDVARAAVMALVRAYCGWIIAPPETVTWTLDGSGTGALLLPTLHVTDVASVTENGTELDPLSDFSWSASGIVRRSASTWCYSVDSQPRWTDAFRGIVIELTHGYDVWPLEVQAMINRLTSQTMTGGSLLTQVGQVSYAIDVDGMPASGMLGSVDRAVLAGYKLPARP